jgi:DNA polymerase-3 subunit chi
VDLTAADNGSPAAGDRQRAAIDFHFNVDHPVMYACRVVRKARAAGKTVLVYTRDPDRLARVDLALWTFSALDFLPHVYADSPLAAATPVWLTLSAGSCGRDLLVLLEDDPVPGFEGWFAGFERIIDIVSREPEDRARARERFKVYRDRGFAPSAHEIGSK